jgi:type VI secretion system secreted protein Hcp
VKEFFMRARTLVSVLVLLLAFPLLAADPPSRVPADPVGVLHFEGQQLAIYSWSWGATLSADAIGGGGGGAGKVQLQDFNFTKKVDRSSPSLFEACATGKQFPEATLIVRKAGKDQQEYLIVKFKQVIVSSYQTGGSSGDAAPMESISFNYASVELQVP